MRKIYINLGCGDGKVARDFLCGSPDFEAYGFDPYPFFDDLLDEISKKYKFVYRHQAAWVNDENKTLYCARSGGAASSLYKEKFSGLEKRTYDRVVTERTVKCFHFSRWIEESFSPEDYIVLYMDVELSEFAILNDMISRGTMKYIDELLVEFHRYDKIRHRRQRWLFPKEFGLEIKEQHNKIINFLDKNFPEKESPRPNKHSHREGEWYFKRQKNENLGREKSAL